MKSAIIVLKEQLDNFYLIRRLSLYELKSTNKNNHLGMAWEILNPFIQIAFYGFVFVTLRGRDLVQSAVWKCLFSAGCYLLFFYGYFFINQLYKGLSPFIRGCVCCPK